MLAYFHVFIPSIPLSTFYFSVFGPSLFLSSLFFICLIFNWSQPSPPLYFLSPSFPASCHVRVWWGLMGPCYLATFYTSFNWEARQTRWATGRQSDKRWPKRRTNWWPVSYPACQKARGSGPAWLINTASTWAWYVTAFIKWGLHGDQ